MRTVAYSSSEGIKNISEIYFEDNFSIIDLTYGKGSFWKFPYNFKLDRNDMKVQGLEFNFDFRNIPLKDQSYDVTVFDPPYYGHGIKNKVDPTIKYGLIDNFVTLDDCIRNLYIKGLAEASRITKNNGIIIVKTTDGCDYYPMLPFILNLRIGKFLDQVIVVNNNIENFHQSKDKKKSKLRTVHSNLIVLRNSYFARGQ